MSKHKAIIALPCTVALLVWSSSAWAHSSAGTGPEFARFLGTLLGHLLLLPLLLFALLTWVRKEPHPSRFVGAVLPVLSIIAAALVGLICTLITLVVGVGYCSLDIGRLIWAVFSKEEMVAISAAVLGISIGNLRRRKRGAVRASTKPSWLVGGSLCLAALAAGPVVHLVSFELKTITAAQRFDDVRHEYRELAFSPDGSTLLALGMAPHPERPRLRSRTRVNHWSIGGILGLPEVTRTIDAPQGGNHTLNGVWLSPDGKQVMTSRKDGALMLWSFDSGEPLATLPFGDRKHGVSDCCRNALFAVRADLKGPLEWLDLDKRTQVSVPLELKPTETVRRVACAPAGDRIAVDLRHRLLVLAPPEGTVVADIETSFAIQALAFSPDGKAIAAGGYHDKDRGAAVRLWSLPEGTQREEITEKGGVLALAYHPDGQRIAVSWANGRVVLYSVESGQALMRLVDLYDSDAKSLAFSADGKQLATGWTGSHPTIMLFRLR